MPLQVHRGRGLPKDIGKGMETNEGKSQADSRGTTQTSPHQADCEQPGCNSDPEECDAGDRRIGR